MDKWANVYTQYLIKMTVELVTCYTYYLFHMSAAYIRIGLCLYVNAMQTDLKVRLEEIHRKMDDNLVGHKFERNLLNEIVFHTR